MAQNRLFPAWYSPHFYALTQLRKVNAWAITHFIQDKIAKAVLLDYGCGDKPYISLYKPYIAQYIGADIADNPLKDIEIAVNTEMVLVGDACADIILSTQVLEHVTNPEKYLQEAARIAKDKGLLFISTHGFFPYHPSPQDYWRWTGSGLRKILQDNGWKVIHFEGIMGFWTIGFAFFQYALAPHLPFILRTPFEAMMQALISVIDKLFHRNIDRRQENCVLYFIVAERQE